MVPNPRLVLKDRASSTFTIPLPPCYHLCSGKGLMFTSPHLSKAAVLQSLRPFTSDVQSILLPRYAVSDVEYIIGSYKVQQPFTKSQPVRGPCVSCTPCGKDTMD